MRCNPFGGLVSHLVDKSLPEDVSRLCVLHLTAVSSPSADTPAVSQRRKTHPHYWWGMSESAAKLGRNGEPMHQDGCREGWAPWDSNPQPAD